MITINHSHSQLSSNKEYIGNAIGFQFDTGFQIIFVLGFGPLLFGSSASGQLWVSVLVEAQTYKIHLQP